MTSAGEAERRYNLVSILRCRAPGVLPHRSLVVPSTESRTVVLSKLLATQSKTQETISVGEDREKKKKKKNPTALQVGVHTSAATMENCTEDPQKVKSRTTL